MEFHYPRQRHSMQITGFACNSNPTILKSYREPPSAYTRPIGQTSAYIEGVGVLDYSVGSDLNSPEKIDIENVN